MLLMNDMHVSKNDIAEFDRNWDEALALCRERSIRDIALGGDLFQSRSAQTLDVLLAVHDALLRAAGAGIRLTIAEGNHDKVNQEDLRGYCHVFDCHPSVTVVDDILTLDDPAWAFSLHMMGYFPEGGSFTSRLAALATSGLVEGPRHGSAVRAAAPHFRTLRPCLRGALPQSRRRARHPYRIRRIEPPVQLRRG